VMRVGTSTGALTLGVSVQWARGSAKATPRGQGRCVLMHPGVQDVCAAGARTLESVGDGGLRQVCGWPQCRTPLPPLKPDQATS